MDEPNLETANIDDPLLRKRRANFPQIHIPTDGDQIPSLEEIDNALVNEVPRVENHIHIVEMAQHDSF